MTGLDGVSAAVRVERAPTSHKSTSDDADGGHTDSAAAEAPIDVGITQAAVTRSAEDDFREFVTARWSALLRTAYLLTGDRDRAEDLVQGALVRAHDRRGLAPGPDFPATRPDPDQRRADWNPPVAR
ncbi:MAG TPA: hypothetical protein VGX23_06050 [Actinocrinis sp.]|nr:hypothetical protein [Actinocrinis sp.]